jgi:sigma54-dependent transcription regulator
VERITLHLDARTALFDFVFAASSPWHWNYRDVIQSAERMVLRARDAAPHATRLVVAPPQVDEEINELRSRWERARGDVAAVVEHPTDWERARERLTPARWEALPHLERWELSYLLAARDATGSMAEAWRWIAERNLLPGSQENVTNPSNAFDKRWRRYRDLLTE